MDFATKLNVHHGHWSDSFNLVVGSSFADRIILWNGRLFHPNWIGADLGAFRIDAEQLRSEEHKSELQSTMRISHADFCSKIQHTARTTYQCVCGPSLVPPSHTDHHPSNTTSRDIPT